MLTMVTPPATTPVTLDEAASYARLSTDAEKSRLALLLKPAVAHVEQLAGRALITRSYDLYLSGCPVGALTLTPAPLGTVSSITYYDEANVLQTLSTSVYRVVAPSGDLAGPATLSLAYGQSWPATYQRDDAVIIHYTAGYGAASSSVPELLRMAVMLRAQQLYDGTTDMDALEAVIAPYRLSWGIA